MGEQSSVGEIADVPGKEGQSAPILLIVESDGVNSLESVSGAFALFWVDFFAGQVSFREGEKKIRILNPHSLAICFHFYSFWS